jgi:cell division protease FtsH
MLKDLIYHSYPTQKKNISENTAQEIDKEIRKIVDEAYKKAHSIIKKNINQLHKLAKGLLHYETLTGDEIKDVIKGKKIKKSNIKNTKKKNVTLSPVPTVEKRKKKNWSFRTPSGKQLIFNKTFIKK